MCSAALGPTLATQLGGWDLVLHPHQIVSAAQTCLFQMTKGKVGSYSQDPEFDYTHHQQGLGISQKAADVLHRKRVHGKNK